MNNPFSSLIKQIAPEPVDFVRTLTGQRTNSNKVVDLIGGALKDYDISQIVKNIPKSECTHHGRGSHYHYILTQTGAELLQEAIKKRIAEKMHHSKRQRSYR